MEPSRDCRGDGPEPGCILLLKEGHSDLCFVGFALLWDPFFSSFPGTVDDITFLITSDNHMADGVNTILYMVVACSSLAKNLGECSTNCSPPELFFLFFFLEKEISSRTLIPLFMSGSVHSGPAMVRFKVCPDASFNYVACIVYK